MTLLVPLKCYLESRPGYNVNVGEMPGSIRVESRKGKKPVMGNWGFNPVEIFVELPQNCPSK